MMAPRIEELRLYLQSAVRDRTGEITVKLTFRIGGSKLIAAEVKEPREGPAYVALPFLDFNAICGLERSTVAGRVLAALLASGQMR